MESKPGTPLVKYQSHKTVWAAKVVEINPVDAGKDLCGFVWSLDNGGYVPVTKDLKMRGGDYPIGGYYVRYEDGFESWSPAEAFEKGYSKVD